MTSGEIAGYQVRSTRDRSVEFRFADAAIRGISVSVMRGFGITRRRGAEVGGLLLGRTGNGIVTVDDFEAVPCEYAYGPSWLLSASDKAKLSEAIARWGISHHSDRYAVGWFRSHTRDKLRPDGQDQDLFRSHFSGRPSVLLLIRPFATRNAEAALFLTEDGHIFEDPALEFEFSTIGPGSVAAPRPEIHLPHGHDERPSHPEDVPALRISSVVPPASAPEAPLPVTEEPPAGYTDGAADRELTPLPVLPVNLAAPPSTRLQEFEVISPEPAAESLPPPAERPALEAQLAPAAEPAAELPQPSGPELEPLIPLSERERSLQKALESPERPPGDAPRGPHRDLFQNYVEQEESTGAGRILLWAVFTLAALGFGGAVGYRYAGGNLAAFAPGRAAVPSRDDAGLALTAGLRGESILIQWDRSAAVIDRSLRGAIVVITPGGRHEIPLEPEELRHGMLLYKTDAAEASIRLEVFLTPNRLIAEQTGWTRSAVE